ncbi:hypothetical protein [Acetonema longum]|uniref:Uncharacterized protein n=1 Tax=Acetonema longum DSM 6540 TaxID=1009370 RepID=F7NMS2_9FIRM|nr:hypothetical protein [Acetonema longum]EGO62664.1 hypothetical protein ALO_17016 [Acetonema longum DSM 6540]
MIHILPVANGILPRPDGGRITGVFVTEQVSPILNRVSVGQDILVCPWVVDSQKLYPIGVLARITDRNSQIVTDETGQQIPVVMIALEGRDQARWHTLKMLSGALASGDVERMDFKQSRKEYPVISGAGWLPEGGYTEFRAASDIPVTLYGKDLETGDEISIRANLGGLVSQEQAHTVEHAIIRSLRTFDLCSPRTLAESIIVETGELKRSVEAGFRFGLPEVLGRTSTGICGNPMTNLAHDFFDNLSAGRTLNESLAKARLSAMSQLTQDIGLTTQPGIRVLQGLKKGMSHDDTPLRTETAKKVIARFPLDPWRA